MRGAGILVALILGACSPSSGDAGPVATTCAIGGSTECPGDQPSLVTCPAGVAFDAGALFCSPIFLSGDLLPGTTALCCGACSLVAGADSCDGGGLLTCVGAPPYDASSCAAFLGADGGALSPPQWCCP